MRAEGTFGDFRAFLSTGDLYDIPHAGNPLSWRGMRHTHLVHCRLDRSLANGAWSDCYPYSRCYYLDFEGSDHRPLLTILETNLKKKRGIFRYDRSLNDNPEITEVVEKAWHSSDTASVEQRINYCRREISRWNREHHFNAQKAIQEEKAKLDRAQWLALRDKNSGYFHAVTRGRRAVNKLAVLEDAQGTAVYEEEKIVQVISAYFQDIFISRSSSCEETVHQAIHPCISEETNETLIRELTPEEIKAALFSISPDKASGPDGFSACFFQKNWSLMGPQITKEVKEILAAGIIPNSLNETHVRLIPKVPSPKSVSEYRPIALCNVYYKIISKLLTKRLQPILSTIISENQTAFIPGRAISDNVLITHEVLHYLKGSGATKHCSMAVKTDMSKAYDRLKWNFIAAVLDRMGFHPKWTNWIFQCISTVSYTFLVNRTAQRQVFPQHYDFLSVPITFSTSHGWRGILIGRDLLKSCLGRVIGNGASASVWNDLWLSLDQPSQPIGPQNHLHTEIKVSELLNNQNGEWLFEKIKKEVLPHQLKQILAIKPSKKGAPDSYIWLSTKSGDYSVKTGYHSAVAAQELLTDPHNMHDPINWMSDVWNGKFSPKLKVFLWKTLQETLLVGENLLNRGLMDTACCIHCGELETTEHLFFHCPYALAVWSLAPFSITLNLNQIQSFSAALTTSKSWICLPPIGAGSRPLFPWIVWAIWKARNTLIFEDRLFQPEETIHKAVTEAKEWQSSQLLSQPLVRSPFAITRSPDQIRALTYFTDGAWCKDSGIGGSGWIVVDNDGTEVSRGHSAERFVSSPLAMEALAIRSALNHALENGFSNIILKPDAEDLIRALNTHEQIKEIYGLLFDIHALAFMFSSISFISIRRSENALADAIAKSAKNGLISLSSQRDPLCRW
ncbi:unnamed protein product [Microthlaspi erraticum]|uniref:Reverse transcriptase domain-containing protein n=1 Tax=Microthlaspi erraticum TaxID=1685480 RepID=A0A6D2KZ12_9BRAS|nr:unnamed protein product [Microthlaspi erraticum]